MSDNNEGECKAAAKECHHHAKQAPLVVNGKWQVLSQDKGFMMQGYFKR